MKPRPTTSASNLHRRSICPGSHAAEAGRPNPESADSTEGTLLHELDAHPDPIREAELTTEQREVLELARACDEEIFRLLHGAHGPAKNEPYEEGWEKELWFRKGLKPLFPGHCDRWRYYPQKKLLVIIDKKFGRSEVTEAATNLQLRAYAVMAAAVWDCNEIIVVITQPRLHKERRVTYAEYRREDIPAAREHLQRIWDACQEPNAPRVADEEACRYCRARLDCDAYRAKFAFLAEPSRDGRDAYTAKLASISDDDLDSVWRAITFAKLIEDAAKAEILSRIATGGMTQYEPTTPAKVSTIEDTATATGLLEAAGLTHEDILASAKLSKEKLTEKLLDRRADITTVAAAKRKLKEVLAPVLVVTERSPSLKRRKDALPPPAEPSKLTEADLSLFPK